MREPDMTNMPEQCIAFDTLDGITIDPMEPHHVDSVMEIETASFTQPWSRRGFEEEILGSERSISLSAMKGEEVVGYGVAWHVADEIYIANIAVHSSHQRRGIASLMLSRLLELGLELECTVATLEVRQTNRAAIDLYNRFGFLAVAIRKGYYRETGEDACVMIKDLREAEHSVTSGMNSVNEGPGNFEGM